MSNFYCLHAIVDKFDILQVKKNIPVPELKIKADFATC